MIGIEDIHIGCALNVAGGCNRGTFLFQDQSFGAFGMLAQRDFLDVQNDVGHIFTHACNGRELMQHAIDMNRGDGRALER